MASADKYFSGNEASTSKDPRSIIVSAKEFSDLILGCSPVPHDVEIEWQLAGDHLATSPPDGNAAFYSSYRFAGAIFLVLQLVRQFLEETSLCLSQLTPTAY